ARDLVTDGHAGVVRIEGVEIRRYAHYILNRQREAGRQRCEYVGEYRRERQYGQRRYTKEIRLPILKQCEPILIRLKGVAGDTVVGTDHGLLLLAQAPGNPEPRCEVVPVHSEALRIRKWCASICIWRPIQVIPNAVNYRDVSPRSPRIQS